MRIDPILGLAFALLIAGCSTKPASQGASTAGAAAPPSGAQGPGAPAAAAAKSTGVAATPAASPAIAPPAVAGKNADKSAAAKAPVTAAKSTAAPAATGAAAAVAKSAAAPLDLTSLTQRLKDTNAIGVLSKIALKNQVDDLLDEFRQFYQGKLKTTLAELRRPYDLLVLKVLSLLQDADPSLASAVVASREAIWGILADPKKFATVS